MPNLALSFSSPSSSLSSAPAPRASGGGILSKAPSTGAGDRNLVERFDVNSAYQGIAGEGANVFASLGQAPAYVFERPVALANVVSKRLGGPSVSGGIEKTIGSIPILGDILGRAGDVLNETWKWSGGILNSRDVSTLRENAGRPDDTQVTRFSPEAMVGSAFSPLGALLSVLADLGGTTRPSIYQTTIGDLRQDMARRGFTPEEITAIEAGQKSDYDFGDHALSQNALSDMLIRVATDPTNVLLATPLAEAKVAQYANKGWQIAKGAEVFRGALASGAIASKAVDATRAAQAIAEGNMALGTMKGLGTWALRVGREAPSAYRKLSIGTTLGTGAVDVASDWAKGLFPENSPQSGFLEGVHGLASDILNERPWKDSTAFVFVSAAHFPLAEYTRQVAGAAKTAKRAALGDTFAANMAKAVYGDGGSVGRGKLATALGGKARVWELRDYIDDHIVFDRMDPKLKEAWSIASVPEGSLRALELHRNVHAIRDLMRERGEITDDMRVATFRDWFENSRRGALKNEPGPEGIRFQWVGNEAKALDEWVRYRGAESTIADLHNRQGIPVVVGYRQTLPLDVISALRERMTAARVGDTVPAQAIRDMLVDYRQLAVADEYWARYNLREAADGNYAAIQQKLAALEKDAPTIRELTAPFAEHEKAAGASVRTAPENAIDPAPAPASRTTAEAAHWGPDEANLNAARDSAMMDELMDVDGVDPVPQPRSIGGMAGEGLARREVSQEALDQLADAEYELLHNTPGYTVEESPNAAILFDPAIDGRAGAVSRYQQFLQNRLYGTGPLSAPAQFLNWLWSPVKTSAQSRAARQELLNQFASRGATVEQVNTFGQRLNEQVKLHQWGRVPLYRTVTSLPKNAINTIAAEVFGDKLIASLSDAHLAPADLLDRAMSRFYRGYVAAAEKGGARGLLGRLAEGAYTGFQPTALGGINRNISKVFYYMFRFLGDPRWWAMNQFEADALGLMAEGPQATRFGGAADVNAVSDATRYHAGGGKLEPVTDVERAIEQVAPEAGAQPFLFGRHIAGYVSRVFDARRPESTIRVLDEMANEPVTAAFLQRFGGKPESLAAAIEQQLYDMDRNGVGKTVDAAAKGVFTPEELRELTPLIERVKQVHEGIYRDATHMFMGNPDRRNMERLLNNYFLYWPLSYQLKAGKWLYGALTERALGMNTNLLGAAKLDELKQMHEELMVTDQEYYHLFADNPDLWLMAQMMLPITPVDLGVSLSRPVRYFGGLAGIFPEYKKAQDPMQAALAVTEMGPLYTYNLLTRMYQQATGQSSFTVTYSPSKGGKKIVGGAARP